LRYLVYIMPSVRIGENAVVGAFSFVNQDIPDDACAYGTPAKVVKIVTFKE
jgi:acetyltransferase-like isoleucine patch superfamily enzyme